MKLEDFIIVNRDVGIRSGRHFRYDHLHIHVGEQKAGIFAVSTCYPAPDFAFSLLFDIRKMDIKAGELTMLHGFLRSRFFPALEEALRGHIKRTLC